MNPFNKHHPARRRRKRAIVAGLLTLLAAGWLTAGGSWRGKPASEWTQEEAEEVLNDSPWARTVEVYQPSGRILGILPDGSKVVYQDAPSQPPHLYSVAPVSLEPEVLRAVYAVRWSSAATVQAALQRLGELSPVYEAMQAPPPELSREHLVLTARVVTPPAESNAERLRHPLLEDEGGRPIRQDTPVFPDLFSRLSEEGLRDRAELRLSGGGRLKAERAIRHGLGTGEGVSFFFPRQQDGRTTVAAGTDWVEFAFSGEKGGTLKARFRPGQMRAGGAPDY